MKRLVQRRIVVCTVGYAHASSIAERGLENFCVCELREIAQETDRCFPSLELCIFHECKPARDGHKQNNNDPLRPPSFPVLLRYICFCVLLLHVPELPRLMLVFIAQFEPSSSFTVILIPVICLPPVPWAIH